MNKNIVLVGFMGTGKTTIAKKLAKFYKMPVIDTDEQIEIDFGTSIKDVFAKHGEIAFRDMETSVIKKIAKSYGQIISTGGGAVLREENLAHLKQSSVIICLKAYPKTILKRLEHLTDRPLLQFEDRLDRIENLLDERECAYSKADFFVQTDDKSTEQIVQEIKKFLDVGIAEEQL